MDQRAGVKRRAQPGLPVAQVGGLAAGAVQAANKDWKETDRPKTKMMAMINKRDFFKILGVILIVFKYYYSTYAL